MLMASLPVAVLLRVESSNFQGFCMLGMSFGISALLHFQLRALANAALHHVQVSGHVHHDRRLHQMMLAEDCKAWDVRFGAGQEKQLSHRPATAASTRLAELSSSSACLASHGSPADSASSLHAECLLTQESSGEDAGSSAFRYAFRYMQCPWTRLSFYSRDDIWLPFACRALKTGDCCEWQLPLPGQAVLLETL